MKTAYNHLLNKTPRPEDRGSSAATRITTEGDAVARLGVLRAEFFTTGLLGFLDRATDRGLSVVGGSHSGQLDAVKFRPEHPPIVWTQILPSDDAVSRQFERNAVLGAWGASSIFMAPLPQLSITLNWVTKRPHALAQLTDTQRIGGREVLIKVHAAMIVAFATNIKRQMLRVARATLRP